MSIGGQVGIQVNLLLKKKGAPLATNSSVFLNMRESAFLRL